VFHQGMLVQNAHRIQSTFAHPNPFSFYLVMMRGFFIGNADGATGVWFGFLP
jgi:uncharacterized membrane protein YfcA